MDERVYFLAKELNEELNKNPDVILLNELDKKINDSFEVYNLSKKKDELLEAYVSNKDAFGEDDKRTKESLKALSQAKEELNTHPLVKEYLEVYSRVRDLYSQINDIVINDFVRGNKKCQ